jgi:endonuclease-3 related protein
LKKPTSEILLPLYQRLYDAYGKQHWWPADTAFEVMVGAILTQNTAWTNVEKAISQLKRAKKLDLIAMQRMTETRLATLIRPSGYFNVKARRLKSLCQWLTDHNGIESLHELDSNELRLSLLAVHGIGPETADDILLYAFNRPVFVIDTYTRRLLITLGLIDGKEGYEVLRQLFQMNVPADPALYNEYHALIVRHAKQKCSQITGCIHCRIEAPFI